MTRNVMTSDSRSERRLRAAHFLRLVIGAAILVAACGVHREETVPNYRDDIAPVVASRCVGCHNTEGAWRATSYRDVIGCVADGTVATRPNDAPLLRALAQPTHATVADTRPLFERWIAAGAPAFRGGVHAASFGDPRSPASHGRFLRAREFRPMMNGGDRDACGRCHDGSPNSFAARVAAPGATPCTTCHSSEGGPLGCTTCHGSNGKSYPPRDACYFPNDSRETTHAAHASAGVACGSCHPTPTTGAPAVPHGDGHLEVWLSSGTYDATNKTCTTRCHAGPGALRPIPTWGDPTKIKCGDCHGAPPPKHPLGACSNCHNEALHLNGRVDVGDGSGKCGACHGSGDDPWPSTNAHPKHKSPSKAAGVACSTCHPTPEAGHPRGDGKPIVRLLGVAAAGGRAPSFNAADRSCASTHCHDGVGAAEPTPKWTGSITCGGCHSIPPPPPHSTSSSCGMTACHAAPIAPGTATHVDGRIQL
jgi:predicted CxxxxCH...CXXCH cytochrome family protein